MKEKEKNKQVKLQRERYVRALFDHQPVGTAYLCFRKDDIIRVFDKPDLEQGWLYGLVHEERGKFPEEYVEEYEPKSFVRSPEHASGWGDSVISSPDHDSSRSDTSEPSSGKFSMMEFAIRYFRHERNNSSDKRKEKTTTSTDEWTWKSLADLVKYTKVPLQHSLLNYNERNLNRMAVECCKVVMKFMGDLPLDRQDSDYDLILYLLRIGKDVLDLRDEIYCQLVKQTTNNKSDNWESCKRGWMLLMICAAYFDCSQWLKPYLVRYFEVANDPKREFHGAASVCEQNLIKSFKHGGRKQFPSKSEMTMLLKGKYTKHERVVLPGNSSRLVKITTSSTTADAVKQICQEMGLETDEEFSEYSMFTYLEDQNLLLAAQGNDYIFDVFSQLEKQDIRFVLAFRKVIWYQTVKFSNPILVEVLYNQILPDLLNGYLLHAKEPQIQKHMGMQSHDEIALLAALQHRINGSKTAPSLLETSSLIPVLCNNELSPNLWVTRVQDHFHSVIHLTAQVARKRFLEIISSWPYFGSSFYYVKNSSHVDVTGECILAVNRDGVHFLSSNSTETMVSFPFNEILSTRNLRTDTGRIYLDLKCGNLMVQKVTRMETPRKVGKHDLFMSIAPGVTSFEVQNVTYTDLNRFSSLPKVRFCFEDKHTQMMTENSRGVEDMILQTAKRSLHLSVSTSRGYHVKGNNKKCSLV